MPAAEIKLSTIGFRGLRLAVAPAALREAAGGTQIALECHDAPLIVTLTRGEARWLAGRLLATRELVMRDHHEGGRPSAAARGTVALNPAAVPHILFGQFAAVEVLDREVECLQAEDHRRRHEQARVRVRGDRSAR